MMSKVKSYIFLFFFSIVLMPICVLAKDDIILKVDKTNLTIGDEVTVSASTANELDYYAIIATLKYDSNVFQEINENNFLTSNISSVSYNKENNKFGIINRTGKIAKDGNLFSIHLKVKEDAYVGDTNISLTNISSSDGKNKVDFTTSPIKVVVTRDAKEGETIPTNEENIITEDMEEVIETHSNKPLLITIIACSLVLLAVIIWVFIKRKNKILISCLIGLEVILVGFIAFLLTINFNKNDVNKDGIKDYNDAEEIIKYLIDIKGTNEDNKDNTTTNNTTNSTNNSKPSNNKDNDNSNSDNNGNNDNNDKEDSKDNSHDSDNKNDNDYDTNNDGKVDIEDVGHVVDDVNKNTQVTLTEQNTDNEYYVNKGEITLRFKADVTPKEVKILKVKIDNEYYDVLYVNGIYEVKIETPTTSGEHDFEIVEVELDNARKIETSLKITREILKDEPLVDKFDLNEEDDTLSFELEDKDNAFIEGTVTIYEVKNKGEQEELVSSEVEKEKTTVKFALEEDKNYSVKIIGTYDLDSVSNDGKNYFENENMFTKEFAVGGDYNFKLTDISITDAIEENEIPIISFVSTNNRNANINVVNIETAEKTINYNISKKDGNNYEVELIGANLTPGEHDVLLNDVELDTLKTFYSDKDFKSRTLTYTVLKNAPSIDNLVLENNKKDKLIKAAFTFKDENLATTKLSVVLVDSTGKIVTKKELNEEDFNKKDHIEVSLSYEKNYDGFYTVKILGDYELSDKYKYTNKSLGENSILTTTMEDIYIESITPNSNNYYPTKNKKDYVINFAVHVGDSIKAVAPSKYNKREYNQLQMITINGLNYPVTQLNTSTTSDYKVTANITIPNDAGILHIKANRVQLGMSGYYNMTNTDIYSVKEEELIIDVLKDKPKIENLTATDNYDENKVTFNFDVILDPTEKKENFSDGTIELGGIVKDISAGHNEVTFTDVEKDTNLDLIFKGSYDLDSGLLDNEDKFNKTIKGELFKDLYGLYNNDVYENIAIENGIAVSENDNRYFEKNEKIKLDFEINNIPEKLEVTPEKVVISNQEYNLTKTLNGYELILDGNHSFGEKKITITNIILDNGKNIVLKEPYTFKVEVLKDVPIIEDFAYEDTPDNVSVTLNLKDVDKSIIGNAKVIITSENGEEVYKNDLEDKFSFPIAKDILRYYIKVVANYDRDINTVKGSDNYHENAILLEGIISLEKNNIELKDIVDINLYKTEKYNGEMITSLLDAVNVSELKENLQNYFVEIKMENLPSVTAKINKVIENDGILSFVLEYEYMTKVGTKEDLIKIDFGTIDGKIAKNNNHPVEALNILIEELKSGESVTLNRNYDASSITTTDSTYITGSYTGKLDGNGHTIKNLTKPLFNKIDKGGVVENLILEEVVLEPSHKGALANETNEASITNVIVDHVKKDGTTVERAGGLIGDAVRSTIESCGVKDADLNVSGGYLQQFGGLIGRTEDTTINNCYATGRVVNGYNFTASLVGNALGSKISNSYTNVTVSGSISCDLACSYNKASTYINNIALGSGGNEGMFNINGNPNVFENNYYLKDGESKTPGIINITKEEVNRDLFINRALFSSSIWDFDKMAYGSNPRFEYEKTSSLSDTSNTDYDENMENLYSNLLKLAPFYDSDKIISLAKNVSEDLLINDEIMHVVPVDKNGALVTYLTTDNENAISKIKLIYKSGKKATYDVIYDKTYDMVVTYKIPLLNIDYNYNHYVINSSSNVVNNLTNYLKGLDYTNNLDVLTSNDDSRIYRDFYNETTKNELKEFVLKYLANSNYTNTTNDNVINNYIEKVIKEDNKIEKSLYVYNYLRRFYDLDIDGIKLYDFVMFNMNGFNKNLTPEKIVNLFMGDGTGANFNTSKTGNVYRNLFSNYTNLNRISNFLEYVVTHLSDHNMDEWTASQFKGILKEVPVEGHPEIQYTLWDHFSTEDDEYKGDRYAVYNYVLPILTLPRTAAYIISAPAQFTIGAQRVYMSNPDNKEELLKFETKMQAYVDRITSYYNTAYAILKDAKIFNDIHLYQVDKRTTKNENGASVYNNPYSTQEPFHKNFDEVVNIWPASYGVNAGNWGDRIEWNVAGFMDTDLKTDGTVDEGHPTFMTWSHETAHYLDDRLFLRDYDRRFDAGGEDYADAFLMQEFSPLAIVMNLTVNYKDNYQVASNTTPKRIDSPDKIKDFYSKMFETIYAIDYIEAQAFLKLSNEEKAEIGIQVSYPNQDKYTSSGSIYRSRLISRFSQLTASDWESMELNDIDDLIKNRIVLAPGIYKVGSRGDNSYGGEGINSVHWYQPNNPYGRPDSYSLKWLSYEMLGYAGYNDGFVEYASNINSTTYMINNDIDDDTKGTKQITNYKTDNMAIKTISKGEYNTITEYKQGRFKDTKNKLQHLKYINVDTYAQKLYDALVKDAVEMKNEVNRLFTQYKGEDNCLKDFWCTRYVGNARGYPNSTKVRQEIYFELKDKTNDFIDDIYSDSENQNIEFAIVTHE